MQLAGRARCVAFGRPWIVVSNIAYSRLAVWLVFSLAVCTGWLDFAVLMWDAQKGVSRIERVDLDRWVVW